jgi:hypothetical protein
MYGREFFFIKGDCFNDLIQIQIAKKIGGFKYKGVEISVGFRKKYAAKCHDYLNLAPFFLSAVLCRTWLLRRGCSSQRSNLLAVLALHLLQSRSLLRKNHSQLRPVFKMYGKEISDKCQANHSV